jgi:membrane-associated protein
VNEYLSVIERLVAFLTTCDLPSSNLVVDMMHQIGSAVRVACAWCVNPLPLPSASFFGLLAAEPVGEAANQGFNLMETLRWSFDLLLHLDDELKKIVTKYGVWSHLILFVVIFCETGLVVTPFLPGDSLLFAAGAFAADGSLRIEWLIPLLIIAAILGDTVNYWMGYRFGEYAFNGRIPLLKRSYLERTHKFFWKYGPKTIVLARFVPIIRTFAPFVAGMGSMNFRVFFVYNVVGAVAWVLIFVPLGYWFGTLPFVKKNFELVMVAIVLLSVAPPAWEFAVHKLSSRKRPPEEPVTPVEA